MKKHLSVLMLFIRSTLYKFLLIILAMAVTEGGLFVLAFRNAKGFDRIVGLDQIIAASHLNIICAVCFLLLCVLLCLTGCELGSKQGYTLSHLRISRRAVIFWQFVNNLGHVFLLLAVQIGIILALCGVYNAQYRQPQSIMLVFYQNDFLHSLLPLTEWSRFVFNVVLIIALAVTMACFPVRIRAGKKPLAAFIVVLFCVQGFSRGVGSSTNNISAVVLLAIITFAAIKGIWKEIDDEAFS